MEPIITLRSDNVDGCDWEECLGTAFLLATEINEGLRDEVELRKLIQDWWYETLDNPLTWRVE